MIVGLGVSVGINGVLVSVGVGVAEGGGTSPPTGVGVGVPIGDWGNAPAGKVAVGMTGDVLASVGAPGIGVDDDVGVALGGSGVAVWVTVGVGDSGTGMTDRGSTPGGMTITPGVPALGGVTTINPWIKSGVGVNVGALTRVGGGVGVGRTKRLPTLHPLVTRMVNSPTRPSFIHLYCIMRRSFDARSP